jgi:predicted unusual protein kinase regulating ubiquinone biosynthesis (AarF/ABC1/UbiB family)
MLRIQLPMTAVLAIAAVLIAVTLLLLLAGRERRLQSGRVARLFGVGRLTARLWASWLGATIRRTFARGDRRARIDAERRRADAQRVAETMGHMKGALMKLGQMLSFVSDDIPEEYRAALASLQASAPPMDFALLRDVAERELKRPLERAFARFDEKPLASASIGQVHRAQLPTGEEVVVKIQYPGVAEAIRGDLANVDLLYQMMGMFYSALDAKAVSDELRVRIIEELDYTREAQNQRNFRELYCEHPFIRVPRVFDSHSTGRVLTSEYVAGRRFSDILQLGQEQRDRYGEILYRFVFGSILRFGVFNGDPHPGNYLFDDQGRVVFLDFGCVKYFPAQMLANWKALVTAHLRGNRAEFGQRLIELGFITALTVEESDTLFDYFGYFYEPFHEDRRFAFSREYNRKSFRMIFKPEDRFKGYEKKLNMPADFVFVNRIQWGVYSILADLAAGGNWHRIDAEYRVGGEPCSELGRADRDFFGRWCADRQLSGTVRLLPEGVRQVA